MNEGGDKLVTNGKSASKERSKSSRPFATVKFGSATVPIYRSERAGRARFILCHYRDGKRIRKTFSELAAAKTEAMFVAPQFQAVIR